jgi:branched-chain amino acid transport system substrate-binding protein
MNTLSDTYFGVTGWTKLDENGDRVHWDYDIWAISENNGNYDLSKTLYFIVVH